MELKDMPKDMKAKTFDMILELYKREKDETKLGKEVQNVMSMMDNILKF